MSSFRNGEERQISWDQVDDVNNDQSSVTMTLHGGKVSVNLQIANSGLPPKIRELYDVNTGKEEA